MFHVFLPAITGVIVAMAGVLLLPAPTAAAATCPTVDPSTGAVSPAPAPDVNWSGCNLTGADLTGADLTNADLADANLYLAVITSANFTGVTLTGVQSGDITYQSQKPPTLPANWAWIPGGFLAGPEADLAGAYLAYANDMNGLDLQGANLNGANMNDVNTTNVNFTSANLDNATITGGIWTGDTLNSATLTGADLNGSDLENSTVTGADFTGATLSGTTLSGDDLTNANLTNAYLFAAKVTSDNLTDATLSGANLGTAKLTGDNLAGAALAGATLTQVTSSGLTGTPASLPANWSVSSGFLLGPTAYLVSADMSGANLTNADLSNANLNSATLTGATLTGADLSNADINYVSSGSLTGTPASLPANWTVVGGYLFGPTAMLYQANLSGLSFGTADLQKADLQDANLANANLGNADMTEANLDGVTSGGVVAGPNVLPLGWFVEGGFIIGPGANLDNEDLANFNFTNFGGEYLAGIQLANTNLENTDFSSTSLTGANLTGADLTDANLTDSSLTAADIDGANFSGVSLTGVVSGQITGTPLNLPAPWQLLNGYLIGPDANLVKADLGGVAFNNADLYAADLYQAGLTGATWSNTICPDGTNSDNDGDTCVNNLNTPPQPSPSTAGRQGAHGWYTSAVTVTWNWADTVGQINPAKCTKSTTSTGQGQSVTLKASCTSLQGLIGTAAQHVRIDTTPPQVLVTGVASGQVYPLGEVLAARCATTDKVSGVATAAKVDVTGTSSHGTGRFTATCTGAVNNAGITAAPVSVRYSVGYRFGGFATPKPGSTLPKSARAIAVTFRLDNASDRAIPASWAAALGKAGQIRVKFTGPRVSPVTAACAWKTTTGYFKCWLKVPTGIETGKTAAYKITAQERLGTAFAAVPTTGKIVNPEIVHFR